MMVSHVTRCSVKVTGLKCAKVVDFKDHLLHQYAHNQKDLTLNYDTPKQYLNFNQTDF